MIDQSELEALLETLARDQIVNLGIGGEQQPAWFRARVISHEAGSGRVVLTCYMDRPTDRRLEPGEQVEISATRVDDATHSAPMVVEYWGEGTRPEVHLRIAGAWQPEDERRHQVRVAVHLTCGRARRWSTGAWHDLHADIVDVSSRGVGLSLDQAVNVGERLSLVVPLNDGEPDLRVTVELRHVRHHDQTGTWRAGGLFKTLPPADHERIVRFVFGELRSRHRL